MDLVKTINPLIIPDFKTYFNAIWHFIFNAKNSLFTCAQNNHAMIKYVRLDMLKTARRLDLNLCLN